MRQAGFEPARPLGHQALNLARLPFHHRRFIKVEGFEPSTSRVQGGCSDQAELHPVASRTVLTDPTPVMSRTIGRITPTDGHTVTC